MFTNGGVGRGTPGIIDAGSGPVDMAAPAEAIATVGREHKEILLNSYLGPTKGFICFHISPISKVFS